MTRIMRAGLAVTLLALGNAAIPASHAQYPTNPSNSGAARQPFRMAQSPQSYVPGYPGSLPQLPTDTGAPPARGATEPLGTPATEANRTPSTTPSSPEGSEARPYSSDLAPEPGAGMGTGADTGAGANAAGAGANATDAAMGAGTGGGLSGGGGGLANLSMLGDMQPILRLTQARPFPQPGRPPIPGIPQPGSQNRATVVIPSARQYKIAENQSPQPQDRIYFGFNYFNDLNSTLNRRAGSAVNNISAYRYSLGFEKTLLNQRASIGLRVPINVLTGDSPIRGLTPTSSSVGDLAVILKYALLQDRDTGNVFSVGMLINTPTGTNHLAGAQYIRPMHYTALQPYMGAFYGIGDFYFQGFSAIDVPMSENDVTIIYNDVAVGYYLYRTRDYTRFLTAIAPTFETHVNTPVSHTDFHNLSDPAATPTWVDLTFGVNFAFRRRTLLSIGWVEAVTGPRPFNYEVLAQLNVRF